MKPWVKVFLITVVLAAPAMLLGPVIWPPAEGGPEPSAGQLPFFIFLAAFEAVTFGLGILFLLFGFAPIRRLVGGSRLRAGEPGTEAAAARVSVTRRGLYGQLGRVTHLHAPLLEEALVDLQGVPCGLG